MLVVLVGCPRVDPPETSPLRVTASTQATDAPSQRDQWLKMFARGYFPGRSGQVFVVPHRGDLLTDHDPLHAFMHGSPWDYDARIPMLMYGPGFIRSGVSSDPVVQQDVAPTIAELLAIPPPPTATGRALHGALAGSKRQPRIVALLVLDGMRIDYFEPYANMMPTLARLREGGTWFTNARANALPTATSIGHATLGTGADPRVHGLVVNKLFNQVTGAPQEAYYKLDPTELMALTLADVWNIATNGRAVIIGQGGAIRATAGLVGRGSCLINGRSILAASYSTQTAGWETNETCYRMSEALESFRGERYWEQVGGMWMGHNIADAKRFRASAVFQRFEGEALASVLEHESLGTDDTPDLVFVNLKGPDFVSHAYGPDSPEIRETLAELDRQLTTALGIIERKAGIERSAVVITADHGMPSEPTAGRRRIRLREVVDALDGRFSLGGASIVQFFGDAANAQIHLDTALLAERGFNLLDVAAFLEQRFFLAAFTEDEVREASAALPLGQ